MCASSQIEPGLPAVIARERVMEKLVSVDRAAVPGVHLAARDRADAVAPEVAQLVEPRAVAGDAEREQIVPAGGVARAAIAPQERQDAHALNLVVAQGVGGARHS